MKRHYVSPKFEKINVEPTNSILNSSVEHFSSYIDPEPGDWGDPIIDPDDDINW